MLSIASALFKEDSVSSLPVKIKGVIHSVLPGGVGMDFELNIKSLMRNKTYISWVDKRFSKIASVSKCFISVDE